LKDVERGDDFFNKEGETGLLGDVSHIFAILNGMVIHLLFIETLEELIMDLVPCVVIEIEKARFERECFFFKVILE